MSDTLQPASPGGVQAGNTERLEERVHDVLLVRIREGSYPPGGRLPPEYDLAEEFGVSRPVVRAALARLRGAGLVLSRRGSGSFVNPVAAAQPLTGSTGGTFPLLRSIDDFAALFEYRSAIESLAAAGAARFPEPERIAELRDAIVDMENHDVMDRVMIEHDIRFHSTIAEMCGNRFAAESFRMMVTHLLFVGRFLCSLEPQGAIRGGNDVQNEHRAIVDAIERGDPEAARLAMSRHIAASHDRIFRGG